MNELAWEYWQDDGWYVGHLKEKPNVVSQGKTMEELAENIRDAYELVIKYEESDPLKLTTPLVDKRNTVPLHFFLEELKLNGCYLRARDSRHHVFANPKTGRVVPVPHHPEIRETLARAIRKQLGLA